MAVAKTALLILATCYLIGLIAGAFLIVPIYLFKGHWPEWTWWQYLLAPLALGLLQLVGEWLLHRPAAKFAAWHGPISQWKKAMFLVLLVVGVVAFLFIEAWVRA
jgi:hypothetical protein